MDSSQMQQRCPGSKCLGAAFLKGFAFVITARGFASIRPTVQGEVWGVLWDLTPEDESALDRFEGVQVGCYAKQIQQVQIGRRQCKALVYVADSTDYGIVSHDYAAKILRGAKDHGLPKSYRAKLTAILGNSPSAKIQQNGRVHHLLFVYGTLKREFPNHHLLANSTFVSAAKTLAKFALYSSGIPYAVKGEQISSICGELFVISPATLQRIDKLEGHPNWYSREVVTVVLSEGQPVNAWIYFYPAKRGKLILSGEFTLNHSR